MRTEPLASNVIRFARPAPAKRKVLHASCGQLISSSLHKAFQTTEWQEIHPEYDEHEKSHFSSIIRGLRATDNASFDAIWSSKDLEMLSTSEVPIVLTEYKRILKSGGILLCKVPDLRAVCEYVTNGLLAEPIADRVNIPRFTSTGKALSPLDIIFGVHADAGPRTGFDAQSLKHKIEGAGFRNVLIQSENLELWAKASK